MPRFVWLSDIHLSFVPEFRALKLCEDIRALAPDGILIGGDIGEAPNVVDYLQRLVRELSVPIYFVLGNHDFYYGSIPDVRNSVHECASSNACLTYLTRSTQPIRLAPNVGLVGHDGWADGRAGDYRKSTVRLNDYRLIQELAGLSRVVRGKRLRELGDEAAQHIRQVLPAALDQFDQVVLLTHVPPLHEACWHEGHLSDDDWAPHFVCVAMGEAILEVMGNHPEKKMTVLCGHTHGEGVAHPSENVTIYTAGADYECPRIAKVMDW